MSEQQRRYGYGKLLLLSVLLFVCGRVAHSDLNKEVGSALEWVAIAVFLAIPVLARSGPKQ